MGVKREGSGRGLWRRPCRPGTPLWGCCFNQLTFSHFFQTGVVKYLLFAKDEAPVVSVVSAPPQSTVRKERSSPTREACKLSACRTCWPAASESQFLLLRKLSTQEEVGSPDPLLTAAPSKVSPRGC